MTGYAFCAEAVEQSNPWMPVIGEIAKLVIEIVGPVVVLLVSAVLWKILGKLGIEKNASIDNLIRTYVKQGINYADSWAEKQAQKPTGDQKMAVAIQHVTKLIGDSKLPEVAEHKLTTLIESQLSYDKKTNKAENESKVING